LYVISRLFFALGQIVFTALNRYTVYSPNSTSFVLICREFVVQYTIRLAVLYNKSK